MLRNPFTPTRIAGNPEEFFGRRPELQTLSRSLGQGSVAIQGPMGIGKSSLLSRSILDMEGFGGEHAARAITVVADREVESADDMGKLLLQSLVDIDEEHRRVTFKIGSLYERESAEITRNFETGKHVAAVKRLLQADFVDAALEGRELILAIDEADKSPAPIARVVRSIVTDMQLQGANHVRFLLAGVSPFFTQMIDEDPGVARFCSLTITLGPLSRDEAEDLVHAKLALAVKWAEEDGFDLSVESVLVRQVVDLSGGHPHLLQLLGSHLIEKEDDEPRRDHQQTRLSEGAASDLL